MLQVLAPEVPELPREGDPAVVLFLRGLPASGKSTFARRIAEAHPEGAVARINNDELSTMLFGAPWGAGGDGAAAMLESARTALLRAALGNAARIVVVDNTNLSARPMNVLAKVAAELGAVVRVEDAFLRVPVEECVARDAARENPVGRDVIERLARQARRLRTWTPPEVPVVTPYANDDVSLPEAVLVDVDGTLALMQDRGPFEWSRVGEDLPNAPVVEVVRMLHATGVPVIVLSGRDGVCEGQTRAWLDAHVAPGLPLFMRAPGDVRKDSIVKHELFHRHVAGRFRVKMVLDDRDQVVALWRALGVPCWQVADGTF